MQYSVSESKLIIYNRRITSFRKYLGTRFFLIGCRIQSRVSGEECTVILLFNIVATTCYNKLIVPSVLSNDRPSRCDYFEQVVQFSQVQVRRRRFSFCSNTDLIDIIRCTKVTMKRATRSHDTLAERSLQIPKSSKFRFRECWFSENRVTSD